MEEITQVTNEGQTNGRMNVPKKEIEIIIERRAHVRLQLVCAATGGIRLMPCPWGCWDVRNKPSELEDCFDRRTRKATMFCEFVIRIRCPDLNEDTFKVYNRFTSFFQSSAVLCGSRQMSLLGSWKT